MIAVVLSCAALALAFGALWYRARSEVRRLLTRFGPVVDLDAEHDRLVAEKAKLSQEMAQRKEKFNAAIAAAMEQHDMLVAEVAALEAKVELASFGLYTPYYAFDSSERYKQELDAVRSRQANMLRAKTAAICATGWTVEGSAAEGRRMVDRILKMQLRAFNGECDAAVGNVKYNNVVALEARIRKSFDAINKLGETNHCAITSEFLRLKLAELRLAHEYAEKAHAEREEQRRIREQMREEERALREIEKAQKEAEKEEERFSAALERAREELGKAGERRREALQNKVAELETRLAQAHEQKERAMSLAQQTRSGHVYVISNPGSFGEAVYKIGMTRRLDPMDRVRELGDASVPFAFDVHAIIYSQDAPSLEANLHRELNERRVNLVNPRKEFFAVELETIEQAVSRCHGEVEFVRTAAAEEFRESVAIRGSKAEPSNDNGQPVGSASVRRELAGARARLAAV